MTAPLCPWYRRSPMVDDGYHSTSEKCILSTIVVEEEQGFDSKEITFIKLRTGTVLLQYNGYRYRKVYRAKKGTRWVCSMDKNCNSFLYVNDDCKIMMACEQHDHPQSHSLEEEDNDEDETQPIEEESPIVMKEEDDEFDDNELLFIKSRKGKDIVQYNGFRYRKAYKAKSGTRWLCSMNKNCNSFLYLNDDYQILMACEQHDHPQPQRFEDVDSEQNDTAIHITSRKGKEMLLFRKYTYRKQYDKGDRCRWVCSTVKNCRACVFTDNENYITSSYEEHCHEPPKYYLKPQNVLEALREPVVLETD